MISNILGFASGHASATISTMLAPLTTPVSWFSNTALPTQFPDLMETINAFASKAIGPLSLREWGLAAGRRYLAPENAFTYTWLDPITNKADLKLDLSDCNINSRALVPFRYTPSYIEANLMLNRELITPALHNEIINFQTTRNPALAQVLKELRYEIPGPADLIRFAVRDVFSPEIVQQFEMSRETPTEIRPWMNKQGYGQPLGIPLPVNATNAAGQPIEGEATWFDLYWQSHWDLPSPTQGYQMLHRLYDQSRHGPSPFNNPGNTFTSNDLSLLLKASDYPAYWRSRLEAISYHSLNRSDVMPMFRYNLINEATLYHGLRADGYRDEEAQILVRFAYFQKAREMGIEPAKKTKQWVCKAYVGGMIDRADAINRLASIGITEEFSNAFLDSCDREELYNLNKERISTLKRGFITGVVSEDGARNLLNEMNITVRVVNRYMTVWNHLKFSRYKHASTRNIIKAYSQGLINRDEIIARLQNLQYNDVAISTMLGLAEYDLNQKRLRILQQQQKQAIVIAKQEVAAAQKAAKEAKKLAKEKETNIEKYNNKRLRGFIKASSDKNIIEWFKKELIELWEVYYRLYYKDYSISDAYKWVQNKLPDLDEEEYTNAEIKAQKVYRSEPNPPLS